MIVSYLPEPEQHPLWPGIQELLKPAAALSETSIYSEGDCVWVAFDGPTIFAAGTTVLWDDGVAQILQCGGHKHKEWIREALSLVEAWARSAGANRLTMRGRVGWARYLRDFGWAVLGTDADGWMEYEKQL